MLHERVKLHKTWKDTETFLSKKKDEQTKLEEQRKTDKLAVVTREIAEVSVFGLYFTVYRIHVYQIHMLCVGVCFLCLHSTRLDTYLFTCNLD